MKNFFPKEIANGVQIINREHCRPTPSSQQMPIGNLIMQGKRRHDIFPLAEFRRDACTAEILLPCDGVIDVSHLFCLICRLGDAISSLLRWEDGNDTEQPVFDSDGGGQYLFVHIEIIAHLDSWIRVPRFSRGTLTKMSNEDTPGPRRT